jgi:hypothetical protein
MLAIFESALEQSIGDGQRAALLPSRAVRDAARSGAGAGGEATASREKFEALPTAEQDAVVEFPKSSQVLPPDTRSLIVDERGRSRAWP